MFQLEVFLGDLLRLLLLRGQTVIVEGDRTAMLRLGLAEACKFVHIVAPDDGLVKSIANRLLLDDVDGAV